MLIRIRCMLVSLYIDYIVTRTRLIYNSADLVD